MPPAVNGAVAPAALPGHPIQAPPRSLTIGASAATSPPGLVIHASAPSARTVERRTGRRLATMTSSWMARGDTRFASISSALAGRSAVALLPTRLPVTMVGTFWLYCSDPRAGSPIRRQLHCLSRRRDLPVTDATQGDAGRLPRATLDWALFLDVDGTLLDIAETPLAVVVPREVLVLLSMLHAELGGAVALASGRSIATIDQMFRPLHLPAAGQHGLERRGADGIVARPLVAGAALDRARERLSGAEAEIPGLLIEDKGDTVAVHYRRAPSSEREVERRVAAAVHNLDSLELVPGKKVIEIRPRGAGKDKVVEAFMAEAPFRGRIPVFVGDDRTDEDGFAAVNRLGGHSIRVGDDGPSAARFRLPSPVAVRDWLATVAGQIVGGESGHDDGARSVSK